MLPRMMFPALVAVARLLIHNRILSLVYQLFTAVSVYEDFSCTMTAGGQFNTGNNIENIHNSIHDFVGGKVGHMAYPEVAQFDPVFWFHHA